MRRLLAFYKHTLVDSYPPDATAEVAFLFRIRELLEAANFHP